MFLMSITLAEAVIKPENTKAHHTSVHVFLQEYAIKRNALDKEFLKALGSQDQAKIKSVNNAIEELTKDYMKRIGPLKRVKTLNAPWRYKPTVKARRTELTRILNEYKKASVALRERPKAKRHPMELINLLRQYWELTGLDLPTAGKKTDVEKYVAALEI